MAKIALTHDVTVDWGQPLQPWDRYQPIRIGLSDERMLFGGLLRPGAVSVEAVEATGVRKAAAVGEVLAKRAGSKVHPKDGPPPRDVLVGVRIHRLVRAAVDAAVSPVVTLQVDPLHGDAPECRGLADRADHGPSVATDADLARAADIYAGESGYRASQRYPTRQGTDG